MSDLARIDDFLATGRLDPSRLILIRFADSQGRPAANLKLSKDRAVAVARALQQRGVNAGTVTGFGDALPVADNLTEEGRDKNRRVEVFVRAQSTN